MKIGDSLPDFKAYDQDWNEFFGSSLLGQPCVIFFYPKDHTLGCTKEACAFRDSFPVFESKNAKLVGISNDSPEEHFSFKDKHNLQFTLLHDKGELKSLFGVADALFGLIPSRETFVFDEGGKLIHHFANQIRPEKHVAEALAVIQNMN